MIKEKLQRGTLIYKLYLYYQLFFRYKLFYKKKNYSQFDEDLFLINFFKNKKNGKFVDLGAFHPIRYNNTYMLYKRGWSGTNIDLNPTAIDMFNIVRNKDINKCALVSKQSNIDKTVYYEHNFSPVNSLILSKNEPVSAVCDILELNVVTLSRYISLCLSIFNGSYNLIY